MSSLIARWDDFSKGDPGMLDKDKIVSGYFTGENVVLYRDGTVGPRAGIVDLAPNMLGLPAGTVYNMGYVDLADAGSEYVWVHKGTRIARTLVYNLSGNARSGQNWILATGTLTGTPTNGYTDSIDYDPRVTFITLAGDNTYKIDWSAMTVTKLTGSPGGNTIETYKRFLIVGGSPANPNRLYYSSPGSFNSWPAQNFFDIGPSGLGAPRITAMRLLRDQLLVFTEMGEMYVLTGVPGTSFASREFLPGDIVSGPADANAIGRTRDGSVVWTRKAMGRLTENGITARSMLAPVAYTGGTRVEKPELGDYLQDTAQDARQARATILGGQAERVVTIMDRITFRALMMKDDAWMKLDLAGGAFACQGERGEIFFTNANADYLYGYQAEYDRPASKWLGDNTGYVFADVTDAGGSGMLPTPYLYTPEFHTPNDANVSVQRVDVLANVFYTNGGGNTLDVFVQSLDAEGASELVDTVKPISQRPYDKDDTAGAYITGGATVGTTGPTLVVPPQGKVRRVRLSYYPNDQRPAPAIRVLLRPQIGVAIRAVLAYGNIIPVVKP